MYLLLGLGVRRDKCTPADCDLVQSTCIQFASPLHVARGKLLVALLPFLGLGINWGVSLFPEITRIMSNFLQRSICEHALPGTR